MLKKVMVAIFAMSSLGWGQAKHSDPPSAVVADTTTVPPAMSATAQYAVKAMAEHAKKINEDQAALQQVFSTIDGELKKQFPGWHLSAQTLTLEKDAPPPTETETPKKK